MSLANDVDCFSDYNNTVFVRITTYAIKLSPTEMACKAGMDAMELQKDPVTEIFREPKFSRLLCTILASSIQNIQLLGVHASLFIPCLMGLETPKYVKKNVMISAFSFPFSGAIAGYVGVLLWKSMKGHDTISQGWLNVFFLIPLLSIWTLYYVINLEEDGTSTFSWHDGLVVGFWLSISMLSTQLGGYFGIRSQPIRMPIVIRKHTLVKNYWAWCVFLLLGSLTSVVCYIETYIMAVDALSRSFSTSSKIYSIIMAFLCDLLFVSSCCLWLAIQKMQLCFGNSGCIWPHPGSSTWDLCRS